MCDNRGSSPDIIICDGTSLGFRKQLLLMTADDQENDGNVIKRTSSVFPDMFFSTSKPKHFCGYSPGAF